LTSLSMMLIRLNDMYTEKTLYIRLDLVIHGNGAGGTLVVR